MAMDPEREYGEDLGIEAIDIDPVKSLFSYGLLDSSIILVFLAQVDDFMSSFIAHPFS